MSLATTTTLGYSIGGGLQAGAYGLATLGYELEEVQIGQFPLRVGTIRGSERRYGIAGEERRHKVNGSDKRHEVSQ
jgi:hypothetical protein